MSGGGLVGTAPVAHALLDADGRLLSADPALTTLNLRAGGAVGALLAVPQLATLARLARRLGILVSRSVVVADADADVTLWIRVQPDDGGFRLSASGWTEARPWQPAMAANAHIATPSNAEWRWDADAALRLTFVSLDAGARHGFDALALLGQPLTVLFTLESDEGLPIVDALAERRAFDGQRARVRASGKPVMLSAVARRDVQGGFAGFVGSAQAVEVSTLRDAPLSEVFMGSIDAALKAPLARIIANADSINAQADGPIAHDYADYAADIASAGRHLMALVDDLVDAQGIEQPDFALVPDTIDLADLARRAAGLLAVRAGNAQVTIARPEGDLRAPALGDFRRVLQILVNLIGNAVRYAPPGSVVRVEAVPGASVTVIDAGKGIAAEDQQRIFDKFARVDPSEPGGNGLGLYIARRLARAMGGDLTVESAIDAGARFTLILPDAARGEDHRETKERE